MREKTKIISQVMVLSLILVAILSYSIITTYAASNPNLALGKTATASSIETRSFPASNVTDGNLTTRWSAGTGDPQWIVIDLGISKSISFARIFWESAYASAYQIQVSNDNVGWTTVWSTTAGIGAIDHSFTAVSARYVRVYSTARATRWTYSIFEIELYESTYVAPPPPTGITPFKTEITVRTVENFNNHSNVVTFMDNCVKYGVTTVSINCKEDEDDIVPSGYVFYLSTIAPIAPGWETFDAVADVITEAHARGIKVKAWIPQFHDAAAKAKNPSWQMMHAGNGGTAVVYAPSSGEIFVSPVNPDVQAYERSIIRELVTKYDFDGIYLDWIRFDDYDMDLGTYARTAFQAAYGYDPVTINWKTTNAQKTQWQDWRTTKLAEYFAAVKADVRAIKSTMPIGVYVLPPSFVEVGQDLAKFANSIDYVAPMSYYADWGYTPSWVYNTVIPDCKTKIGANPVKIIPTFDCNWPDSSYVDIQGNIRTKWPMPEIDTLDTFLWGSWTEASFYKVNSRIYK